jgi:hypothetical protein
LRDIARIFIIAMPVSLTVLFLSRFDPLQGFGAKHLFVAAMVAGVHPRLPRIGKSGHDGGASAFGAGEVFRGSKGKAPPYHRQAFAPCS